LEINWNSKKEENPTKFLEYLALTTCEIKENLSFKYQFSAEYAETLRNVTVQTCSQKGLRFIWIGNV